MKIFELEQQLLKCSNIVDDLRMIHKMYDNMTPDDMTPDARMESALDKINAIAELYEVHFSTTWYSFEEVCREYQKK